MFERRFFVYDTVLKYLKNVFIHFYKTIDKEKNIVYNKIIERINYKKQ